MKTAALFVLALTLAEEHGWTFHEVERAFYDAVDSVEANIDFGGKP